MKIYKYTTAILLIAIITSCNGKNKKPSTAYSIARYESTPVWEAAKAVQSEDTATIKIFFQKQPSLINFKDTMYNMTLLHWAVFNQKFYSAKTLVEMGADPNIKDKSGESAFIESAFKLETSQFLILLLSHGGDINAVSNYSIRRTPLIAASETRLESVKILVKAGANVNFVPHQYESALVGACRASRIEIVKYLIMEAGADFTTIAGHRLNKTTYNIIDLINDMTFRDPIDQQMKLEVLDYIKKHK